LPGSEFDTDCFSELALALFCQNAHKTYCICFN
jgi:hypothetical protein